MVRLTCFSHFFSWRQQKSLPSQAQDSRHGHSLFLPTLIAVGALNALLSGPLLACETIYSIGGNTAKYDYNSTSGEWELVSTWSDSAALDYVPQPGDQYEVFESQGMWVLYVNDQTYSPPGQSPNPPTPPTDPYGIEPQCDDGDEDDESTSLPRLTISGTSIAWSGGGGSGTAHVYQMGGGASAGPVRLGKIVVSASAWLDLAEGAAGVATITFEAAILDIQWWRQTGGMHYPHSQGSMINWAKAEVNWGLYGANDPSLTPQQVLQNFIQAIEGGGG